MIRVLFSYRHVSDVPLCPCGDPGNYMMAEESIYDPLSFVLRCWCGSTCNAKFDSMEERTEFLIKNGALS